MKNAIAPAVGRRAVAMLAAVSAVLVLAACGGQSAAPATDSQTAGQSGASADPTKDKLAQVLSRGTLVLSTDLAYPPQSEEVKGAARAKDTKCLPTQLTADQVAGYDADTGKLVAAKLGVEPCFVTPQWSEIVSGSWGDRWDIAWGSGAINGDRMNRLWMTQPYRSEPSRFFVKADSPYQKPSDLNGKQVGVCSGCTHELYLQRKLELPGIDFTYQVDNPSIVRFDVEAPGLKAVADGKIDAFLCAETEGQNAIASGLDLRPLDPPAFTSMLTGFVDKKSGLSDKAFVDKVDEVMAGLHKDGSIQALSQKVYGADYATKAGQFDLTSIGQQVQ